MFQLPVKEIIVNDDSQVRALEEDGTVYTDGDIVGSTNTGGLILEGFINEVIWCNATAAAANTARGGKASYFNGASGAARLIRTAASAGTAEVVTFTITAASGAKAGDTYRVVTDSLDLTPTEYQNRPTEKRYQLSVDCGTADAIKTELIARISADPSSQVTAASGGTGIVTLTAKKVGVKVGAYVGEYSVPGQTTYSVTGALAVTTAAALPVGTYDALKNINWAKNFSIDQNINWMPLPGASYNTYYFEVVSPLSTLNYGNNPSPNEQHNAQVYGVRLYVKSGLTLDTALNLVDGDLAA